MKRIFLTIVISSLVVFNNCYIPSNPLDKWAVGTSTGDVSKLQSMVDNGLTFMEVVWQNSTNQGIEKIEAWAKEIREAADKLGITIWSVHIPFGNIYDISKVDEAERQAAVAINMADIKNSSRILSPSCFVIHASYEPIKDEEREARLASCRKSLQELAAVAKACNAILAVEVLPRTCLGNTSSELMSLIDGIDNTAICFDVNHLLKESHVVFIQNTKGKILTTHISDYDRVNERHWLPGKGVIDWNELLKELVAIGYKGPFIFEVAMGNPPTISIEDLSQCWKKLKEEVNF